MPKYTQFKKIVDFLRNAGLYPDIRIIDGPSSSPTVLISGTEYLSFCSNNYLGLASNESIKKIVIDNIKKYGVGSGSTRLLSGTLDVQVELERTLAGFMGFEDSITFSSGYLANAGVIRMLVDRFPYDFSWASVFQDDGVIFSDSLNHASIIDSVRLSKSERVIYGHKDLDSLNSELKRFGGRKKLIITDGVFSMDGDLAPLEAISALAKEHEALVFVDDSHGIGVLGENGEGTAHHLGVEKNIDVVMGSFTKAYGSIGGFIVCNKVLGDYLRITARSYIFSDPIMPAVVAGLIRATEIIMDGNALRKRLFDNANYLRSNLRTYGFDVLGEETPIIPVVMGSDKKAIEFSVRLFQKKIFVPAVRRPAVPVGRERLRITVTSNHTRDQLDHLLEQMKEIGAGLGLVSPIP